MRKHLGLVAFVLAACLLMGTVAMVILGHLLFLLFARSPDTLPAPVPAPPIVQPAGHCAEHLQAACVAVVCPHGGGSGVAHGDYVWTAGHVLGGGTAAEVRVLSGAILPVEVLAQSLNPDLALLRLKERTAGLRSIEWDQRPRPRVGEPVLHCGWFLDPKMGACSISRGVVSFVGRDTPEGLFDQTDATCTYGSSGGMICAAESGRCLGLCSRGPLETVIYFVPVRVMRVWAREKGHPAACP
jgi:hypothetical protein